MARDADHRDALAVAQQLGGDWLGVVGRQNANEVRHGDQRLTIYPRNKVLILKVDLHVAAVGSVALE